MMNIEMPRCFGCSGVGPGNDDAAVGDMGQRGPDLLSVDDPLIAITNGSHLQAGDIGPGARFGEHLAPDLVRRNEIALIRSSLFIGAIFMEHRQAHALTDAQGPGHQRVFRCFFTPNALVGLGQTLAAEFDWIRQPRKAGFGGGLLESYTLAMGEFVPRVFDFGHSDAGRMLVEEHNTTFSEGVKVLNVGAHVGLRE